ncbi:hypothetical protein ACFFUB_04185 [Algimonas porphyrae]|uniref:Uncharacterized protein n=1 Tax=Algimonas porphyrae TaxID=1128113 RepID=A0ABQ5UZ50_9PROT|nr:hypothetical protein [Algimonas porphyrae]GLQ20035.1 hypothetical protein GCM10007854_09900 [Algimonas porphyrae]
MKLNTLVIAAAALMVLPQAASASTKTADHIASCTSEIQSSMGATATDIDFKAVRGNSRLQTLTFAIDANGTSDTVKCKVRRKGAVEIVWGKSVKPVMAKSVQAKTETNAGE